MKTDGSEKNNENVFIVLDGKIALREHQLNNPFDYSILQIATSGSIIGCKSLDMGNSCRSGVWCVVYSNICRVVSISKE